MTGRKTTPLKPMSAAIIVWVGGAGVLVGLVQTRGPVERVPVREMGAQVSWDKPVWADNDPRRPAYGGRVHVIWQTEVSYDRMIRLGDSDRVTLTASVKEITFDNVLSDEKSKATAEKQFGRGESDAKPVVSEADIRAEVEHAFADGAVQAQLDAAGADVAPATRTSAALTVPLVWSVHPKSTGRLAGVITLQTKRNPFLQETSITLLSPIAVDINVYDPVLSRKNLLAGGAALLAALGGIAALLTYIAGRSADRKKATKEQADANHWKKS